MKPATFDAAARAVHALVRQHFGNPQAQAERELRNCRVLCGMALHESERLSVGERTAAYQRLLETLREHDHCPADLIDLVGRLATGDGPAAA